MRDADIAFASVIFDRSLLPAGRQAVVITRMATNRAVMRVVFLFM